MPSRYGFNDLFVRTFRRLRNHEDLRRATTARAETFETRCRVIALDDAFCRVQSGPNIAFGQTSLAFRVRVVLEKANVQYEGACLEVERFGPIGGPAVAAISEVLQEEERAQARREEAERAQAEGRAMAGGSVEGDEEGGGRQSE